MSFSVSVYESQGRFAQYVNEYAESLKAFGPDPAIIPGRAIGKGFKDDAYDYPVAEAYLSYTPAKFINIQFGHGKNFIRDGYRSLLQSDVASPSPFLKLNTKFWKIKYTNNWMWLKDVRPEVAEEGAFLTKYIANQEYIENNPKKKYLSISMPFFNYTKDWCVIVKSKHIPYTDTGGSGVMYIYVKVNEKWVLYNAINLWLS